MTDDIRTTIDTLCQLNFEKQISISALQNKIVELEKNVDQKQRVIKMLNEEKEKLLELTKVRKEVREAMDRILKESGDNNGKREECSKEKSQKD